MQMGDWFNGAAILAVGFFLGLAINAIVPLIGTPFWPVALLIPILFGGIFLFDAVLDGLFARIFLRGVQPARQQQAKERKPLALLLSLPVGILTGVIGAQFGLGELLL